MKKIIPLVLIALLSSCISVRSTVSRHTISSEKLKEVKLQGESCTTIVMGIFISGDKTISAAAKRGNITEISFVENEFRSNPFYSEDCTIVKGQ